MQKLFSILLLTVALIVLLVEWQTSNFITITVVLSIYLSIIFWANDSEGGNKPTYYKRAKMVLQPPPRRNFRVLELEQQDADAVSQELHIHERYALACQLKACGDYLAAIDHLKTCLKLNVFSVKDTLAIKLEIAKNYQFTHSHDHALTYYNKSLVLVSKLKRVTERGMLEINIYNCLALLEFNLHNIDKALYFYLVAERHAHKLRYHKGLAGAYNGRALIAEYSGKTDEAKKLYNRAIEIYKSIADLPGQALSLFNLGALYRSTGQYEKAILYCEASLKLSEKTSQKQLITETKNTLRLLYPDRTSNELVPAGAIANS